MAQRAAPFTKSHPPTSPNSAPATQNECRPWSAHIENVISTPNSPKTAPATKSWRSRFARKIPEVLPPNERRFDHNPRISEHDPNTKSWSRTRRCGDLTHPKPHQILHLQRKFNVINGLRDIWNVISNARRQSSHPPTSPNTAPATKSWRSRFARKIPEVLPPIEKRFDHYPRFEHYRNTKSSSRTRRFEGLTRPCLATILYCKTTHNDPPTSPNIATATQNQWMSSVLLYESSTLRI